MKKILWLLILCMLSTSCGEFFTFEEEPDEWEGITMCAANDSSWVMVGDSLPLEVQFTPYNPNESPVFWMLTPTDAAKLVSDTLIALSPGKAELKVVNSIGSLTDTCRVRVMERWVIDDFSLLKPSDMVIYANIAVDGAPWNDESMIVGAFISDELSGLAVKRQAFGIDYAEIRIWADTDQMAGNVKLRCFDRLNHRLYVSTEDIEYDAYTTLGTLSNLYPININTLLF